MSLVTMSLNKKLALLVSRLFDPAFLIPGMLATAVIWSLVNGLRWRFVLILVLIDGLIPFLYFVHLLRTKEISDWDTTKRQQRLSLYGFTLMVHGIGVLLALVLGKIILAKILFSFWLLALVFTIITNHWKISLHTGVSAAAITFLAFAFDVRWLLLIPILILVAWARIVMKKHTLAQTVAGMLLAPIILLLSFSVLGVTRNQAKSPSQQLFLPCQIVKLSNC